MVRLVSQDHLARLENQADQAVKDLQDQVVQLDNKAAGVRLVKEEGQVLQAVKDLPENQDLQAHLVRGEAQAHQAPLVNLDQQDQQDPLGNQAREESRDLQENVGLEDQLVREDQLDSLVNRVRRAHEVRLAVLVGRDQRVNQAQQGNVDHQGRQVVQVHQAHRADKDRQVQMGVGKVSVEVEATGVRINFWKR